MTDVNTRGDGPHRLLVGVDGSDTSWRAVYYALGRARRENSTAIAVNVMPVAVAGVGAGCAALVDAGSEMGTQIESLAREYDVDARFESVVGDPAGALLRLASEYQADGIVVGASKALVHKIFGSIASRAVRRSPCPVTVVP